MSAFPALATDTARAALFAAAHRDGKPADILKDKTRDSAVEFESVFLNSMFSQMFTGLEGEGPFGGSGASGVWRSFLTDEYSKAFSKAGGIGIADHVYRQLLEQQEASPPAAAGVQGSAP